MAVDIEHPSNNFTRRVLFRVGETKTNKFVLSESRETGLQPPVLGKKPPRFGVQRMLPLHARFIPPRREQSGAC